MRREELGPEGQQLWDAITDGRSDLVVTAEGGLAGPFNAFVTAPGAGRRVRAGGEAQVRHVDRRRLSEIAIITVGARWQAEFSGGRTRPWRASMASPAPWWTRSAAARTRRSRRTTNGPSTPWPASSATPAAWTSRPRRRAPGSRRRRDGGAGVAVRVLHADLVPAERVHRAAATGDYADVGRVVTLPAEAAGSAPGRGRLTGRRVLVVGAGTRPSPEPDSPMGDMAGPYRCSRPGRARR